MAQSVTSAEYFFDSDNGVGTGTALVVDDNSGQLTQSFSIPTTGLSEGFHNLYIRTLNSDNNWSLYHREVIYVKTFEVSDIAAAEYFFNVDNGVETGIPLIVNSNSGQLTQSFSIPTGLSEGFHSLYIRTQDTNDNWSLYHREIIFIKDFDFIPSEVTNAEYFIDSDPGIGGGTPVAFSDSSQATQMLSFSTTGLSEGDHVFYIRAQNGKGEWSIYDNAIFNIDIGLNLENSLYKLVNIYPNPFVDVINIESTNKLFIEKILIYDFQGKEIFESKTPSEKINLKFLAQGIYILKLNANNKVATFKLVKY